MNKQMLVCSFDGILLTTKKSNLLRHTAVWMNLRKHDAEQKKPDAEGDILYDST